ncbi:YpmS family protein [Sporolactobacillus sp. CQH2019]|uniref:YpmS family protein n=1 Tax=Sporolactobacillus sp. CQH2019 TaxID=3023512 RepID=UPI0023684F06|nr:YpmS family protein [Sporolactobacillus sp. CQH2019]MDD9149432.1 YpmS family protein [Sporolactobacillus sp. CQH2019]
MIEKRQTLNEKKRKNLWKAAFFALLFIFLLFVLLLFSLLTSGFSGTSQTVPSRLTDGQAIFTVQANKRQLQNMINDQISRNGNNRLSYQVAIGNRVVLKGTYKLLFTGIPFTLTFDPVVSHGAIILKESNVRVGSLELPDKEVLNFLKVSAGFPDWVVFQPDKQQIYIDLSKISIQNGLYLQAETIDLPKNVVAFTVHQKP